MNLLRDADLQTISNAAAAAQTTVTSSAVDLAGWDGCLFIVSTATVTTGSVLAAQVQACDTSGGTYASVGSTVGLTDSGGATSNSLIVVDYYRPLHRYAELVFTRGTANAALNCILAIKYKAKGKQTAAFTYNASVVANGVVLGA